MNLDELDDMLAFVLNANDQQTASEFSEARRLMALNSAYKREWNEIQLHVSRNVKLANHEFTWAASAPTRTVPAELQGKTIYAYYDVTSTTVVPPKLALSYRDATTLEWMPSGPGAAVTIRADYVASPSKLVSPSDVPSLILDQYHELLVWSAAVWLVEILDRETAPKKWHDMAKDLQEQAIKGMSNRPQGDVTVIGQAYNDNDDGGDWT